MAGTLVAEALARGDMGLAVAGLAPGAVATAICRCGAPSSSRRPTSRRSPATTSRRRRWPSTSRAPLFDVLAPTTTARREGDGFVLDGLKSQVPARRRGRAVRRRRAARRRAGAVPRRGRHRRAHRRGRPRDGGAGGVDDPARARRRPGAGRGAAGRGRRVDVHRVRAAVAARVVRPRGRHRPGGARLRDAVRQGARGVRRADRPPAVGRVHGRRHRDRAAGDAAASPGRPPPAPPPARTSPARWRWRASSAPTRGCGSASTACSCSAATATSRSTPWSGGTATCRAIGVMEGTVLV